MATGFLSRLFTRLFAGSLVREAYAGILGREPDASGLAAHTASVRRTGRLAPVLKTMTGSDEAWGGTVKARAADLVGQLQHALRGSEADSAEGARWTARLQEGDDLGTAAAALSLGPAHWRLLVRRDAESLVAVVYTALLERQPDPTELQSQAQWLAETGDLVEFLSGIGRSDEHTARVLERRALTLEPVATVAAVPALDHEALVISAFQGLLGRDPDPQALTAYSGYLRETGNLAAFLAEVGESAEHRKRMLLRPAGRT